MKAWRIALAFACPCALGCGRIEFARERIPATAITLTADNDYIVAVGTGGVATTLVGRKTNEGQAQIADCPLGVGPEQWSLVGLPRYDELYIYAYDRGEVRGVLAQLETAEGPRPLDSFAVEVCASGDAAATTLDGVTAMIDRCDRGEASASGGWVPSNGTGFLGSGTWRPPQAPDGYPVCPGTFAASARWMWWTRGAADPLVSDPASNALVVRVAVDDQ